MTNVDKKSIINDFYQAAVISVFAIGYLMLGKKILKIVPPSIQKFDSGRHRKAGCYHHYVRDDARVSHQKEDPTGTH